MFKKYLAGALLAFGLTGVAPKSQAIENLGAFTITNFEVDILVKKEAVLEVEEVIEVNFSEKRHGIFRNIPVKYKDDRGFDYNLKLKVLAVKDQNGDSIEYQISSSGGDKVLKIGDPDLEIIGNQRYVVQYEIKKGVRYFEDHDEIFWNPIGTGWPTEIQKASSIVRFEDGANFIEGSGVCFTGEFGSKDKNCLVNEVSFKQVEFEATRVLNNYEGLTIAVHLPKGVIKEPTSGQYFMLFLMDNWGFGLPIVVFVGMFLVWKKRGQEIDLNKTVIAQYEAPDNLTPGELGYLMKEHYSVKFVTADIINLAVKGYLDIYEIEPKIKIIPKWLKKIDYELENKKDWEEANNLTDHEKELLNGLFSSNKMGKIKLSDKKNSFYENITVASKKIKTQIKTKGYFEISFRNKKSFYVLMAFFGGIIMFILGISLNRLDLIFGAILSAPILIGFGIFMSKKTLKGAETYWQAKGYKHYIDIAEKHRAEFNARENIFEKTLPYAMVFGNIDKWAKAFEGIAKNKPDWYHSNSMNSFSPIIFASSIGNNFASAAQTASVSPNSSSSGSGGFSGGGGGGGGGGSW